MDKAKAMQAFWGSFDIPAYEENTVPDNAQTPYITYQSIYGSFGDRIQLTASLWNKTTSWQEITLKAFEIGEYISSGGRMIPYDDGAIWISRGSPFAQRMVDEDKLMRRVVLTVVIEYLSED